MESLSELYRIGPGPSSSHTLAVKRACTLFMEHYPDATFFEVTLSGSLALTGVGHATDKIIKTTFAPKMCKIDFQTQWFERFPNGLRIKGYDPKHLLIKEWTVFSLGGGSIDVVEEDLHLHDQVYPHQTMNEILKYCGDEKLSLADYVARYDKNISKHLDDVLNQMLRTVSAGLDATGILPGDLKLARIAKALNMQAPAIEDITERQKILLASYAYAACEENADGKICVAAPTLGASGIMAALIYYCYHDLDMPRTKLKRGLAVAGIFGNVIKTNATISGAVGGCQAEVGTACAMGSAMIAYFNGMNNKLISYAAEIGMEHHLGLTCDPVGGYVMIPCIERNAVGAMRAVDSALLAQHIGIIKSNRVSFDDVVRTMRYTGRKLPIELKETALGGLAIEVGKEAQKRDSAESLSSLTSTKESATDVLNDFRPALDIFDDLDLDENEIDAIGNKLNLKL